MRNVCGDLRLCFRALSAKRKVLWWIIVRQVVVAISFCAHNHPGLVDKGSGDGGRGGGRHSQECDVLDEDDVGFDARPGFHRKEIARLWLFDLGGRSAQRRSDDGSRRGFRLDGGCWRIACGAIRSVDEGHKSVRLVCKRNTKSTPPTSMRSVGLSAASLIGNSGDDG